MSDRYSGRLRLMVDAARFLGPITAISRDDVRHDLSCRLARLDATWEPHDWSDFG